MRAEEVSSGTTGRGRVASRAALAVVFTTIVIDFAGFSVLIPVLPVFATRLGANAFEAGLTLTAYALAQLLFLPAWGWISDRFGRRPVLLVSLAGTAASYTLLALSDSLTGIYVSRVFAGFFAASIGTAQAVITDVTAPSERARGMGQIGAAIGVAFVLGPALGGLLSELGERAPFAAVAIIAALNLVLCWFLLPETRPPSNEAPDWSELARSLVPAPIRLVTAGHSLRIGLYLYLFFHVTLGFATLESLLPIFLEQRFASSPLEIGILFTALGVVMILTQVLLIGRLTRRMRESSLLVIGLMLCALALASLAWIGSSAQLYPIALTIGVGYGLAWPTFTSLFSQACADRDAGELLGQSQSMSTTGRVLGPIWAGLVMDRYSAGASFLIAAGLLLSAMLAFIASRRALAGDR